MIRLFCGYDEREAIGYHVFQHSVLEHASEGVSFKPLTARGMPVGTNEFTYSRFLVPWLCNFQGHAIFVDACDMLMMGDIAELDALFDPQHAVQVVQHRAYTTKHPIKYIGTGMQCPNLSYPRKNWASVMLINCGHERWRQINPERLPQVASHTLKFTHWSSETLVSDGSPADVGKLPDEWNRIVDEGQPVEGAKILHWTAGIPAFPHYKAAPGAKHWFAARDRMLEIA